MPLRPLLAVLLLACAAVLRAADPNAPLFAMLPHRAHYFSGGTAAAGADAAPLAAQSRAALARLDAQLAAAGLTRASLVYLHAFIAAEHADMDSARAVWRAEFAREFPHPPTDYRVSTVPALPRPGLRVMLEFIAAYPHDTVPAAGTPTTNPALRLLAAPGPPRTDGISVRAGTYLREVSDAFALGSTTAAQAAAVLERLRSQLADENLSLADIVQIRVTLLRDRERDNAFDFAGWEKTCAQYFGTAANPHRPPWTVLTSELLPVDALVSLDFVIASRTAARPTGKSP